MNKLNQFTNKFVVYMIYNNINGKYYIGKTTRFRGRILQHIEKAFYNKEINVEYNHPLKQDIRRYGKDSFSFLILDICKESELDFKEFEYIKKYKSEDFGYNLTKYFDVNVSNFKLSDNQLRNLIQDLYECKLLKSELEFKYNINRQSINGINRGENFKQKNIKYPIRSESEQEIKNKRLGKQTSDKCFCGRIKDKKARICRDCYIKEKSKNIIPKYQLIDLVNKYPITYIGELCGVSDNSIRKWCKKYKINTK